jgi:hypothetical protein
VTRQEDHRDPEADAEFDRELAKLMAESVDARKFDRKPVFDVPLPIRRREAGADENGESAAVTNTGGTMKFALLSKKGNRQQVYLCQLLLDMMKTDPCRLAQLTFPPTPISLLQCGRSKKQTKQSNRG